MPANAGIQSGAAGVTIWGPVVPFDDWMPAFERVKEFRFLFGGASLGVPSIPRPAFPWVFQKCGRRQSAAALTEAMALLSA